MRGWLGIIAKLIGVIVGIISVGVLGVSAYYVYPLFKCGLAGCGDAVEAIEQAVPGPDGTLTAWLVSSDGSGATGEHNLLVFVGPTGSDPIRNRQGEVLWLEQALDLTLRWTGRNHLVVEYPARADVERKWPPVGNVRVTYLPIDTPETSWLRERAAARDSTR